MIQPARNADDLTRVADEAIAEASGDARDGGDEDALPNDDTWIREVKWYRAGVKTAEQVSLDYFGRRLPPLPFRAGIGIGLFQCGDGDAA